MPVRERGMTRSGQVGVENTEIKSSDGVLRGLKNTSCPSGGQLIYLVLVEGSSSIKLWTFTLTIFFFKDDLKGSQ